MSTRDIGKILADEGDASEAGRDADADYVRNRSRGERPSQVYSVRMPVERLEQLRVLADRNHMTPSALVRKFALDGLDRESTAASQPGDARDDHRQDEGEMIVMTPERFEQIIRDAIQKTAVEVTAPLLQLVREMQDKHHVA